MIVPRGTAFLVYTHYSISLQQIIHPLIFANIHYCQTRHGINHMAFIELSHTYNIVLQMLFFGICIVTRQFLMSIFNNALIWLHSDGYSREKRITK